MNYPLYENPQIEETNSPWGNWVIKYSDVSFIFFKRKAQAQAWLLNYPQFKKAHN